MKNIIYFVLVFFLSSLFTSCGKKKTVVIKFTDVVTGEGIPNITFDVNKTKACIGYDCDFKTIESGLVTDENGMATVTYRERNSGNYVIAFGEASQYGYYTLGNSNSLVDHDESEIKEIKLLPSCELKTSYNNVNCFDDNDKIELLYYNYQGIVSNTPYKIEGCDGQTQNNYSQTRAGEWTINYTVTRNGVTESFSESFYLVPFQENEIVINY